MTATRPTVVLVNPAAARATRLVLRQVEGILRENCGAKFHVPRSADELTGLARESARAGSLVVIAGGDGTINLVVNAVAGHDVTLGILPLGTANDLAAHLRIPLEPAAAAARISTGTARRIDLLEVNGRRFCTVGGLGLVSQSAESVNRLRAASPLLRAAAKPLGSEIYALVALGNILFRRSIVGRVKLTDLDPTNLAPVLADESLHGLFFANQPSLGGGLTLPTAGLSFVSFAPRRVGG